MHSFGFGGFKPGQATLILAILFFQGRVSAQQSLPVRRELPGEEP